MIKNTQSEFEQLVLRGSAESSPALRNFITGLGLTVIESEGEIRLADDLELLQVGNIRDCLQAGLPEALRHRLRFEIHRSIPSTNSHVMDLLAEPGDARIVCLAEMQTAGRGRRGRNWVSPFGRNIYLTLGYFHQGVAADLGGLSLVAGMKVVELLRRFGVTGAGLKWPNDVLLDGRKMAGILVELKPSEQRGIGVVLGIGINLSMSEADAGSIDQPWASAAEKKVLPRNELAGQLALELMLELNSFSDSPAGGLSDRWQAYNQYAGEEVRIIRGSEEFVGIDRGVDDEGNLLLETATGIERHNSGEVSLRVVSEP